MFSNCDICDRKLKDYLINNQVFSHLNFRDINKNKKIYYQECNNCNLFYNKKCFDNKIFKSLGYSNSNQTTEKIIKFKNEIFSRSDIQAKYILKLKRNLNNINILDIGSFDGKLLFTILNKIKAKKPNLYGFDINKSLKKNYNRDVNFISNFRTIKKTYFDIIILSHSIMYLKNLNEFMFFFKSNLKKNGKIFIQFSDLDKRPYNIYLSDQYFFPTKYSINKIFKKFGFYSRELKNIFFNNEFIFIFDKKKTDSRKYSKKSLNTFLGRNEISKLKFNQKLKNINNLYIFGTTLEAAYAHSLFKYKKIISFVDENEFKQKKRFRGLNVIHPSDVNKKYKVLFPYNNIQLKNYLSIKFNLELI